MRCKRGSEHGDDHYEGNWMKGSHCESPSQFARIIYTPSACNQFPGGRSSGFIPDLAPVDAALIPPFVGA